MQLQIVFAMADLLIGPALVPFRQLAPLLGHTSNVDSCQGALIRAWRRAERARVAGTQKRLRAQRSRRWWKLDRSNAPPREKVDMLTIADSPHARARY